MASLVRAQTRVPGLNDVEYFAQTLYEPEKFIVPGFNPGMPVINKPPIGLTDQEILCVIAYLQTLGGTAIGHAADESSLLHPGAARHRRPPGAPTNATPTNTTPAAPPAQKVTR